MHACIHTYIQTDRPTYLHTYVATYLRSYIARYLRTCVPTYLRTYVPTYLHTYMPTYLHTYIPTYLHTCIHAYMHTCILTYIHTYRHTYLPTYILTYLHTYILTYLHTYIHTYILTYVHTYIHIYIYIYVYIYIQIYVGCFLPSHRAWRFMQPPVWSFCTVARSGPETPEAPEKCRGYGCNLTLSDPRSIDHVDPGLWWFMMIYSSAHHSLVLPCTTYQLLCIKHGMFNSLERLPLTSPEGNHSIFGAPNVWPIATSILL